MGADLVGPGYYSDPYYQSAAYQRKLADCREIEPARQALCREEATPGSLAYARFLMAVESDASYSHGAFGRFVTPKDADLCREFPFLADAIGVL